MALSSSDAANFAMAVKQAQPGISDADLAALVKEAGDVNDDPTKSAALAAKITPQAAAQSSVNTQLASPYQGAGYNKADLMSQFSPEQLKAAYADQQRMYQSTLPSRAVGGVLAGGSGSGDVMLNNRNQWEGIDKQNALQSIDKQKALQLQATEGLAAGTVAQNQDKIAGEYQLSQAKGAQELAQGVQKTTLGGMNVAQQQRLNNPHSPESMLAKSLLVNQFRAAGVTIPAGLDVENASAQQLMGFMDPNVMNSFKTKAGITETLATAGKTVAETPGAAAESQVKQGVANAVAPVVGGTPAVNNPAPSTAGAGRGNGMDATTGLAVGTNNVGNLKDPKTGQFRTFTSPAEGYTALMEDLKGKGTKGYTTVADIMNRYAPASDGNDTASYIAQVSAALGVKPTDKLDMTNSDVVGKMAQAIVKREGNTKLTSVTPATPGKPMLKDMPGTNTAINMGGVSINANPSTTGSQTGQAEDQNTTRKQISHYATNIGDPADKLLSLVTSGASTGLGAKTPATWSNTQSDAAQKAINKIVAEQAAMNGTAYNQADADTLFKAGPKVVADYVLNMKAEQGRRQLKLASQDDYQKSHNGTLQGYDPSVVSQYKPLYNPNTKKVAMIQQGSDEWNSRVKSGQWVPSATGYYMNQGK